MKILAAAILISFQAWGQPPEVPHKMKFAGMTLTIREDARRELQDNVDALTKSPTYFSVKADRAKAYFPIITDILREERVPDDFKYLVLQESALIPDAVSSSQAVGFWQFKDFTAAEMGLRLDKDVDERMNIVASTHAAAQYLKKNNFYFNNWLYALQAYQMGAGAVLRSVKDPKSGTKEMEITSDTYWYVKTFLAHKIAFENAVEDKGPVQLLVYTTNSKRSLSEVADELSIGEDELRAYNKWAKGEQLVASKDCPLLIPVSTGISSMPTVTEAVSRVNTDADASSDLAGKPSFTTRIALVNDIPAIKIKPGESAVSIARDAGLRLPFFLKCNDLNESVKLLAGEYYYLDRKSNKGDVPNHLVSSGETLWGISQKYGVKLNHLEHYNNVQASAKLSAGKFVWLQNPSGTELEGTDTNDMDVVSVNEDDDFNWGVNPEPDAMLTVQVDNTGVVKSTADNAGAVGTPSQTTTFPSVNQDPKTDGTTNNPGAQAGKTVFHTVVASDTLYGVARQYGVTVKELMDWNDKKDFSLSIGESLRIVVR